MSKKTVIILVNYNNHDDTLKCLKSISDAGYWKDTIVVDNNSTFPGVDEISTQFPNTTLIKNKKNIGFGRANNVGLQWVLKNTNYEFVFFLNNDTIIEDKTIQVLEDALIENKRIAIATPKIVLMENTDILWYGGGEINWRKCNANIPGYLKSSHCKKVSQPRLVSFASGCALLVKRSVLEEIGGFDERFFMYVEDVELCIRIIKNKHQIKYLPDALVLHKCQGSQRGSEKFLPIEHPGNPNLPFFLYHLTKNRILTVSKHASKHEALKFWSFYPFFLLAKSIHYILNKRIDAIKAISKGMFDAFQ